MARRARLAGAGLGMVTAMWALAACGNDAPGIEQTPLPNAPQILPNPLAGFLIFPLTSTQAPSERQVLLLNGGQDPLTISSVAIESPDADPPFALVPPGWLPVSVRSREAVTATVRFTAPDRGAFRASLVVVSNAENYPTLTMELLGPATTTSVPCDVATESCAADIVAVDGALSTTASATTSAPTLLVRLFNVGGSPLRIDRYSIAGADAAMFRLMSGTATPGESCAPETGCPAGASCVSDGVGGNVCAPVWVSAGDGVALGIEYIATALGSHAAELVVSSNDPDTPALSIALAGTFE